MASDYEKFAEGLQSEDPEVVLDSSIWLVENPEQIEDQSLYMTACQFLQSACVENVDCLQYIDEKMTQELVFKAQLFASVVKESSDPTVKEAADKSLKNLIDQASAMKTTDTELVAQIYAIIVEEAGLPDLVEKAKSLL